MGKILIGIVIGIVGLVFMAYLAMKPFAQTGGTTIQPQESCSVSSISISSTKAKWIDACSASPCVYMRGAGELINSCPIAVGVQIKMSGYDKSGYPVASKSGWPASINNIPPGSYVFSLDHWLDYDPSIDKFEVTVESIQVWK